MKTYVTHSTSFDFKNKLYKPVRESQLNQNNEITLPHENSNEQFNSKEYMKDCDLILAEVSFPSTGQGIELGWANLYAKRIICFYKQGTKPSGSLKVLTSEIFEYESSEDLISKLNNIIS